MSLLKVALIAAACGIVCFSYIFCSFSKVAVSVNSNNAQIEAINLLK